MYGFNCKIQFLIVFSPQKIIPVLLNILFLQSDRVMLYEQFVVAGDLTAATLCSIYRVHQQ